VDFWLLRGVAKTLTYTMSGTNHASEQTLEPSLAVATDTEEAFEDFFVTLTQLLIFIQTLECTYSADAPHPLLVAAKACVARACQHSSKAFCIPSEYVAHQTSLAGHATTIGQDFEARKTYARLLMFQHVPHMKCVLGALEQVPVNVALLQDVSRETIAESERVREESVSWTLNDKLHIAKDVIGVYMQ
jgi:hypothetical protein